MIYDNETGTKSGTRPHGGADEVVAREENRRTELRIVGAPSSSTVRIVVGIMREAYPTAANDDPDLEVPF